MSVKRGRTTAMAPLRAVHHANVEETDRTSTIDYDPGVATAG
ncbi:MULTISPECIES: hypothetical protein [Streptomyces]|nr:MULTISPECIES: hypothetical protein [Streptomyces]